MLHLTNFWMDAWQVREKIPPTFTALFVGLLVSGVYFLSASLVFPERPDEWPDLDEYFFKHKRQVLAGAFIADLISTLARRALAGGPPPASEYVATAVALAVLLFVVLARGKWLNTTLLALIILPFALKIAGGQ